MAPGGGVLLIVPGLSLRGGGVLVVSCQKALANGCNAQSWGFPSCCFRQDAYECVSQRVCLRSSQLCRAVWRDRLRALLLAASV